MSEVLGQLVALVENIIVAGGYPGIVLVMFVEGVFPPIPSELIMPFGGFLAAQGRLNPIGVWLSGALGSMLGALVYYHIGKAAGDTLVRRLLAARGHWVGFGEKEYDRVLAAFHRYGEWLVLVGRVIPVVRSMISIPAGAERMPLLRFIIYTFIGTSLWSGILTLAGYLLGERWSEIERFVEPITGLISVLLVMAMVGGVLFIIIRALRRRHSRRADNQG